jgi:hypothetical protein
MAYAQKKKLFMSRFGSRPLRGLAFRALLTLAFLMFAEVAWSQTVKISPATFTIVREVQRPQGEFPYYINYDDCLKSFEADANKRTEIHLTPVTSGFDRNRDSLEVWVSVSRDCTQNAERTATGACRQVATTRAMATGQLIIVSPADVVAALYKPGSDTTNFIGKGALSDCRSNLSANLTFFIMFIAGSDVRGTPGKWTMSQVDVGAPTIPSGVDVFPGDRSLYPRWPALTDSDLTGFTVFCEEISCTGDGAPPDAGAAGSAGASGVVDEACAVAPTVLVPNRRLTPDEVKAHSCAISNGRAATEGTVDQYQGAPLNNGSCYAVAVASRDAVTNISPLSNVDCGSPKEVTTFFEAYSDAGGKGGGGFCNLGAGGQATGFGFLLAALAGLGRRRLRQRRGEVAR